MRQLRLEDFAAEVTEEEAPEEGYVEHPLLRERTLQAREYQLSIAEAAKRANTLVVLPTGLGKTIVALLVALDALSRGKVLVLAPTKPLVEQHYRSFRRFTKLREEEMALFTGEVPPEKRATAWERARVIFATPQTVLNDLEAGRYDLDRVALVVFDEAHRAVGEYAYVKIAQQCRGRILGLTASPGGDREKIREVLRNLRISRVEARLPGDRDVRRYVKGIKIRWHRVRLSGELGEAAELLRDFLEEKLVKLQRMGFLSHKRARHISKKDIIELGSRIRGRLGGRRGYLFSALMLQSATLHAFNLLELVETQGAGPALAYAERLRGKGELSRGERLLLSDPRVERALELLQSAGVEHPKLEALVELVRRQLREKPDSLIIVFVQYRDTIARVVERLRSEGIPALRFVGQASRGEERGMSQRAQSEVLQRFSRGEARVLVASSVAEEGLDIPSVDLVVFYEPVPSEIRAIQRRGRTGRGVLGEVVILIAEGTKDEAYLYAELARERKMRRFVRWLSSLAGQKGL
ncbi:MAG: DEAD/DEAH box helicase [Euryarchaeota archaeon]|nr:DEAD/DEAH box helicase [Euryarchaeota archaeon]